jgi:Ca2+-dependent lipid-binding protein
MPSVGRDYFGSPLLSEWPEELNKFQTQKTRDNFLEIRWSKNRTQDPVHLCLNDYDANRIESQVSIQVKKLLKGVNYKDVVDLDTKTAQTTRDLKRNAWVDAKFITESGDFVDVSNDLAKLEKPLTPTGLYRSLANMV